MSRSGYSDGDDNWSFIRWRGAVSSALRGRRGQAFLRELLAALNEIKEKRLISDEFDGPNGVCALGAVTRARNIQPRETWLEDNGEGAANALNVAPALAAEIMWLNDEGGSYGETPERRYVRMREWVTAQIEGAKK